MHLLVPSSYPNYTAIMRAFCYSIQMASLYTQESKNVLRTWVLMGIFLCIVIAAGWLLSIYFNDTSVLYIALAFALVSNVGAYWFSDKVAIASVGAHPADESQDRE